MIFTLSLAVCYCFSITVVCGYYGFNVAAFTGGVQDCYLNDQNQVVTSNQAGAVNVSLAFYQLMIAGFAIHLAGTFADACFAIRVKIENKIYRISSLVFVCIYTVAWLAWLIWLICLRYTVNGRVCSGDFLTNPTV